MKANLPAAQESHATPGPDPLKNLYHALTRRANTSQVVYEARLKRTCRTLSSGWCLPLPRCSRPQTQTCFGDDRIVNELLPSHTLILRDIRRLRHPPQLDEQFIGNQSRPDHVCFPLLDCLSSLPELPCSSNNNSFCS